MKLPTFKKGVHPHDHKDYTNRKPIEVMTPPEEVFIPLQQHIGVPGEPLVEKGAEVKTGQVIGKSEKFVSSPVHASVTGKVKAVDSFLHPLGMKVRMIHIQRTGEDEWEKMPVIDDWQNAPVEKLRDAIWHAGIVGLGGAAFPTHVKLAPPKEKKIDTFILNGVECEPYLTADHRAMLEMGEKILTGMAIIMKVLGTENGYVGIENNKPDAVKHMSELIAAKSLPYKVIPLKVKYPQGAEKMLIEAVVQRKVPTGGLPMDVGTVVNNVGTALTVADAILDGKPLIERVVTVTGEGVKEPKNVLTRIGTPFRSVIDFCGGLDEKTVEIFMGGPMMGFAQYELSVPVVKATSGIVCNTESTVNKTKTYPCIRCGNCVIACPMNLLPTRLAGFSEMAQWDEADNLGVLSCIECGSCAYVCPSHIPLVQWIRVGKMKVTENKRKKVA